MNAFRRWFKGLPRGAPQIIGVLLALLVVPTVKVGRVVSLGALAGGVTAILAGFFWPGNDEIRATVIANAALLMILGGAFLVIIPRLNPEKLKVPNKRMLRRGAALALAVSALAAIGVGVTASAPRPGIAYVVIGGGLMGLLASGIFWLAAGHLSD